MAIEFDIYISDVKNISKEDCEQYFSLFGIQAQIHPNAEFTNSDSGFVPFKVKFMSNNSLSGNECPLGFASGLLSGNEYLTGFEYSFLADGIDYDCRLKNLNEVLEKERAKKFFGLGRFFGKPYEPLKYLCNEEADKILRNCKYNITIWCYEKLEFVTAFIFASYLVDNCGGVVYDPEDEEESFILANIIDNESLTGKKYVGNIKPAVLKEINEWNQSITSDNYPLIVMDEPCPYYKLGGIYDDFFDITDLVQTKLRLFKGWDEVHK